MRGFINLGIFLLSCLVASHVFGQRAVASKTATYEELYDDPYDLNKLFLHILPVYGEFFRTNISIGYGIKADYHLANKAHMSGSFRMPYSKRFDFMRDNAIKNNDLLNTPKVFYTVNLGGAYHIVDSQEEGKSKFVLYAESYKKRNRWESMVPEFVEVPSSYRRIYAVRAGGNMYQGTIDVNDIVSTQGVSITDSSGTEFPEQLNAYSNIFAGGFYLGGNLTLIKNIAIQFDKTYEKVSNDYIFSAYFDLMYFPFIEIEDLYYQSQPGAGEIVYSSSPINTNPIGFRLGMEGKYNRDLSWSYSIEMGMRPGVSRQGMFITGTIGFPVLGTRLSREVEAFGK